MTHRTGKVLFAGTEMILDPSGALYCPDQEQLVVADLHFEKGRSIGLSTRRPLPPYDTDDTLQKLAGVIERYDPRMVICLGDSFHDRQSITRFAARGQGTLAALGAPRKWIWVLGNHDPEIPPSMGGETVAALQTGPLTFRHDHGDVGRTGIVMGHFHPIALASIGGRIWRRRCFVLNRDVLVLPSFGSYTGGLNILHPDFVPVIGTEFDVWLLGSNGVYPIARTKLRKEVPFPFGRSNGL